MSSRSCLTFLLIALSATAFAAEDQWFVRDEAPPQSKAPRGTISAAETVLLGGGPVVPLRQSERKKPPKPDILAAKVIWGESATFTSANGQKMPIADWNLVDNDLGCVVIRHSGLNNSIVVSLRKLQYLDAKTVLDHIAKTLANPPA